MKTVGILVEDIYQDLEVWYPLLRLKEEGFKVLVIGTGKEIYRSKHGYEIKAEVSVEKIKPEDLNGIIIPGGYAPDILRRYPRVNELVKTLFNQGRVVASICHGGWVLVSAGILKGKRLTSFFAIKDDVVNAGGIYEDKEVVVDGNLITSRKPEDLPAFLREIIKKLRGG
jgi:protease I